MKYNDGNAFIDMEAFYNSGGWSNVRLVECEEFMRKQRSRMMFKTLVTNTGKKFVPISLYLDNANSGDEFFSKGFQFIVDILNNGSERDLTTDYYLNNLEEFYGHLYVEFGIEAFTVMIVRDLLYKDREKRNYRVISEDPRSSWIKDRSELNKLILLLGGYYALPTDVCKAVEHYLNCVSDDHVKYPLNAIALLGLEGYKLTKLIEKLGRYDARARQLTYDMLWRDFTESDRLEYKINDCAQDLLDIARRLNVDDDVMGNINRLISYDARTLDEIIDIISKIYNLIHSNKLWGVLLSYKRLFLKYSQIFDQHSGY